MKTRIAVIADTHLTSPEDLPEQLLDALKDVQMLLHAGDLVNLAVLDRLKQLVPQVKAVCGNMDHSEVRSVLSEKEIISIGKFRIGLTHGRGNPVNLLETVSREFQNCRLDCIVYGHSHFPKNEIHQGILYFNPGSPTDKVFAPYNSYGILEIGEKIVGRIEKISR